jgi:hypothetical protein
MRKVKKTEPTKSRVSRGEGKKDRETTGKCGTRG